MDRLKMTDEQKARYYFYLDHGHYPSNSKEEHKAQEDYEERCC